MDSKIKVYVDESIMEKGKEACAGSAILKGFISPFDATAVTRLRTAGISISGQVPMDEFGIENFFSDETEEVPGAVKAVSDDRSVCVLCNDVFGQIRRQAALNGLYYIRPTYGTVSRYGLIPAVSSMDQVGVLCADPETGRQLLTRIAGHDEGDGAMFPDTDYNYKADGKPNANKIRLALPDHAWAATDSGLLAGIKNRFETRSIELKYYELYQQILYVLSCAEICNNTNRYDGIKFGYRTKNYTGITDLYVNTRGEALGLDTKLAVIMGAFVLSQDNYERYYEKAMKLRRLIRDSAAFDDYDVIALPVRCNGTRYEELACLALPVLAGLPSLTVPAGNSGIQLIAASKREDVLFSAWEVIKDGI